MAYKCYKFRMSPRGNMATVDFQEIYKAFQPKLFRYLKHLIGEADAEDLTQEVFTKVSSALPEFRGDAKLSTWLYRIATNAAIDKLRTSTYRLDRVSDAFDENVLGSAEQPDDGPEQQVMNQEMYSCFLRFLKRLPVNHRAVLILSELEQLPDAEIAEILGTSLETVKIRLHRGRAKLMAQLKAECKAEDWLN